MSETTPWVLVVEDQESEREALARLLRLAGFQVATAADPKEALAQITKPIGMVVSDLKMGKTSGLDLLRLWKKRRPNTPFVIMTAYGEVGAAVHAMKVGALDFLAKPIDPEELVALVRQHCEDVSAASFSEEESSAGDNRGALPSILGASKEIVLACDQARRAAKTDSTVLITGESGAGKELFAQEIHGNSGRRSGPFVTVNMAAVPESLVESELFGHAKGAFTGANASRVGRFEAADGGTLFIDEIGDFAAPSQAKLLRILETQVVTPVGSNDSKQVDVRVVAATSRDLPTMVASGDFREDLYYRLNVVHLALPPLRERKGDIDLLVNHFLIELCEALGRRPPTLTPQLLDALREHRWPGNVRQLKNTLESMVVLSASDTLDVDQLPPTIDAVAQEQGAEIDVPPETSLEELE